MSEIGLGSWLTIGAKLDSVASRALVRRAFDLGINLFDTADVYADGAAEQALGRALADLPRSDLVIATKCFFATSERPNDRGLSRKHLVESVDASLRRLRVDYLDLHQCHRWDPDTPLDETVRAYEDLIRQGKLLYWGVSHWTGKQVEAACRSAERHGGYRPVSSQPEYSILRRGIEAGFAASCDREGVSQIVFSPLAQGALSGKYLHGEFATGDRDDDDAERDDWMREFLTPDTCARIEALSVIARELDVTMAQLAIAWCLRNPSIAAAIVGASRPSQLEDNVRASGLKLPNDVLTRIDQISPPPSG